MKTEEAAKDPKRKPKKRRANYTQNDNGQRLPKTHTTTTPKTRPNSYRETRPKSGKASKGPQNEKATTGEEEPTKQNKSPQRTKYGARQGGKTAERKTRRTTARTTTSPTEPRNDRNPKKYTPTTENATTGEILKHPTTNGQTA